VGYALLAAEEDGLDTLPYTPSDPAGWRLRSGRHRAWGWGWWYPWGCRRTTSPRSPDSRSVGCAGWTDGATRALRPTDLGAISRAS